jgi:hypothetical protein
MVNPHGESVWEVTPDSTRESLKGPGKWGISVTCLEIVLLVLRCLDNLLRIKWFRRMKLYIGVDIVSLMNVLSSRTICHKMIFNRKI